MYNKKLHVVAFTLLVIGGINWLLHALGFNLVNLIFGGVPLLEDIIYILVGISAIYEVLTHKANCSACNTSSAGRSGSGMPPGGDVTHG